MAATHSSKEYIAMAKRCELLAQAAKTEAENRAHLVRAIMFRKLAKSPMIQKTHLATVQTFERQKRKN